MENEHIKSIKIFYSYAYKDENLCNELEMHLRLLKRQGYITDWHNRKIGAGTEWAREISEHLDTSQIILLLVSPDFMASDYCYDIEVKRALERHETGEARVIPIILRHVEWKDALFGKLQPLPSNKKPVLAWRGRNGRDKAFRNIAEGIREVVKEYNEGIPPKDDKEKRQDRFGVLFDEAIQLLEKGELEQFSEKISELLLLEKEIESTIEKSQLRRSIGQHLQTFAFSCFNNLRYEQGSRAFRLAVEIDHPHGDEYLSNMGCSYLELGNFDAADQVLSEALKLNPSNWVALLGKCQLLTRENPLEALNLLERVTLIVSNEPLLWNWKGTLLIRLGKFEEALTAFRQALYLSSDNVNILRNIALTLTKLNRTLEAGEVERHILSISEEKE